MPFVGFKLFEFTEGRRREVKKNTFPATRFYLNKCGVNIVEKWNFFPKRLDLQIGFDAIDRRVIESLVQLVHLRDVLVALFQLILQLIFGLFVRVLQRGQFRTRMFEFPISIVRVCPLAGRSRPLRR